MMHDPDTDELIRRVADDDTEATELLVDRYRDRLRRMIAVRLDRRVLPRLDPSDVVQDVLVAAIEKLPRYAREQPIALYPWLRQLAWEHLVDTFRKHVLAQRRAVDREVEHHRLAVPLPDQSCMRLADVLVAQQSSPSLRVERNQMIRQVQEALGKIGEAYREVLVMRYLEELLMREIAQCLGASEAAIKMRHMRALKRLGKVLTDSRSRDET